VLDDSRKLAGLTEEDPRNLLSREARIRIDDAYNLQYAIRAEAHVRTKFLGRKKADAEMSTARVAAAFTVLEVYVQEFLGIGKRFPELGAIMEEELEGSANSLELTGEEKLAVRARLYTVKKRSDSEANVVEITEGKRIPIGETQAAKPKQPYEGEHAVNRLTDYLETRAITQTKFASICGTTSRTIRKFLASGNVGKSTRAAIAGAMGITPEVLFSDPDLKSS